METKKPKTNCDKNPATLKNEGTSCKYMNYIPLLKKKSHPEKVKVFLIDDDLSGSSLNSNCSTFKYFPCEGDKKPIIWATDLICDSKASFDKQTGTGILFRQLLQDRYGFLDNSEWKIINTSQLKPDLLQKELMVLIRNHGGSLDFQKQFEEVLESYNSKSYSVEDVYTKLKEFKEVLENKPLEKANSKLDNQGSDQPETSSEIEKTDNDLLYKAKESFINEMMDKDTSSSEILKKLQSLSRKVGFRRTLIGASPKDLVPPQWGVCILKLFLPSEKDKHRVLGDIEEEFNQFLCDHGCTAAKVYFWKQFIFTFFPVIWKFVKVVVAGAVMEKFRRYIQ
jgi:hypothetical protein